MTAEPSQNLRADASDNRERILAAARAAFLAEGLDVPVREIARRAGVGAATLYRRFPSKQDLVRAAFDAQITRCGEVVEEGLAHPDPWLGLGHVLEHLMVLQAVDRGLTQALFTRFPHAFDLSAGRDRAMRGVGELLRRVRAAGGLRPEVVLEDVVLAVLAAEGLHTGPRATRVGGARRLAGLLLQSFRDGPAPAPLPPPVRLPLPAPAT